MLLRALIVLSILCASLCGQAPHVLRYPELLEQMTALDWLWTPPTPGEGGLQFSSWDRGSEKGIGVRENQPWDPKGWYANHDRGFHLRVEEREGKEEHVMAEVEGPGVIVRIWSANPTGTLFFYIDGAQTPSWEVDFKALTGGAVEPFAEPLAGVRARGANCYAPFPFAKHLKLSCSERDVYYHVNVRLLERGTQVESFAPGALEQHSAAIAQARERLAAGPPVEACQQLHRDGVLAMRGDPADPEQWGRAVVELEGPMVIRELTLRITRAQDPDLDLAATLRRVRLRMVHEGRVAVDVPVADFFGSAPAFRPYASFPLGVRADGTGYCRYPMPIPDRATIELVADGPLTELHYELGLRYESRPLSAEVLAFRASWHLRTHVRTRPISDFRVLNARGPGRFAGCTLVVANPSRYWWGEGDEKFFVDGEAFPSTFGTGTEDYFGYAWGDPTPFAAPQHAQPQADGPECAGYICLDRFHLLDSVPFQRSFLFDLEIWHWKDVFVDYATTAFWYGAPGAPSGLPAVPPWDERIPEPIEAEPILAVPGAIEAEGLEQLSRTGGETETPLMGWYLSERWSGEKHLFWKGARPGDEIALAVPVPAAGRYRVEAAFTMARDYATVELRLDHVKLAPPIDLYTPHVVMPSRRLRLAELDLPAGPATLVLRVVGKNERSAGHMVGIDYLRLVPIGD